MLAAIMGLGEKAYGVSVQREIEERSKQRTSTATVYLALNRLEEKGFVTTRIGDAEPQRGGRRKCFYEITGKGEVAFKASLSSLMPMLEPFAKKWGLLS